MSNTTEIRLVPELRFPEFNGEWIEAKLGQVSNINPVTKELPEYFMYIDLESVKGNRLVKENYIYLKNAPSRAQRLLDINDIIFQLVRPYQRNNLHLRVDYGIDLVASTGYAQIRSKLISTFLFQTIQTDQFVKKVIEKCTGTNYPAINVKDLANITIFHPFVDEQQKIASTLSSLDDLIGLEEEKLKAYQNHKRGLMQQLFPAAGAMVPQLRFAGFEGEWVEKKLKELTNKIGSGITPKGGDKAYKSNGRPFVRSQNVGWGKLDLVKVAFIDEKTHNSFLSTELVLDDVLLNITGASIGRCALADHRVVNGNVNQHVCIIRTKIQLFPPFLMQWLLSDEGQNQISSNQAGGNRQGLNFSQIGSFCIICPPTVKEQQIIAATLSSLDHLVELQIQKIATLKQNKAGLMQVIFPELTTD